MYNVRLATRLAGVAAMVPATPRQLEISRTALDISVTVKKREDTVYSLKHASISTKGQACISI